MKNTRIVVQVLVCLKSTLNVGPSVCLSVGSSQIDSKCWSKCWSISKRPPGPGTKYPVSLPSLLYMERVYSAVKSYLNLVSGHRIEGVGNAVLGWFPCNYARFKWPTPVRHTFREALPACIPAFNPLICSPRETARHLAFLARANSFKAFTL